jgi:hypothetical protein
MSMYVDLLSSALVSRVDQLRGDALLAYVLSCRAEMLASGAQKGESAYAALALEIAYDRALLKLCAEQGIAVKASEFSHPQAERRRLEGELAQAGLDLAALTRRRRRELDLGGV